MADDKCISLLSQARDYKVLSYNPEMGEAHIYPERPSVQLVINLGFKAGIYFINLVVAKTN